MTGTGTLRISAVSLPVKETTIAIIAAPPITQTLKTRVIAMTPMFSP